VLYSCNDEENHETIAAQLTRMDARITKMDARIEQGFESADTKFAGSPTTSASGRLLLNISHGVPDR
jgi:hypothetical protein